MRRKAWKTSIRPTWKRRLRTRHTLPLAEKLPGQKNGFIVGLKQFVVHNVNVTTTSGARHFVNFFASYFPSRDISRRGPEAAAAPPYAPRPRGHHPSADAVRGLQRGGVSNFVGPNFGRRPAETARFFLILTRKGKRTVINRHELNIYQT